MKKMLNYNQFIKNINESHDLNFLNFGNFNDKPLPKTDDELRYDRNLSLRAIEIYDDIFGTSVKSTYGDDFGMLVKDPSIKQVTSGDVIKKLIDNSYTPNWYSKFEIQNNSETISGFLLDQMVNKYQGKPVNWKPLIKHLDIKMKMAQRKSNFMYNIYQKFGSEFNHEIILNVFDIKTKTFKYDTDDIREETKMNSDLEKAWWKCIKWALSHYKDYCQLTDIIEKACGKLVEITDNQLNLIDNWVDSKVDVFTNKVSQL